MTPGVGGPRDRGRDKRANGHRGDEDGKVLDTRLGDRHGKQDGVADTAHQRPEHEEETSALVLVRQEGSGESRAETEHVGWGVSLRLSRVRMVRTRSTEQ